MTNPRDWARGVQKKNSQIFENESQIRELKGQIRELKSQNRNLESQNRNLGILLRKLESQNSIAGVPKPVGGSGE